MRLAVPLLVLLGCPSPATAPGTETALPDPAAVGHCAYVNAFSGGDECKEYTGDGWNAAAAASDCQTPGPGAAPGVFTADEPCDRTSILAECFIRSGEDSATVLVFPGEYGDSCAGLDIGCSFAGGEYVPSESCTGQVPATAPPPGEAFRPFEQICTDPLPGEPPGASEGQVCTWQAISGSTEEDRYFGDYADCGVVLTQRPYWAAGVSVDTTDDDPRLSDASWVAEYEWVTRQVEASACVCCHSTVEAPNGEPSGWHLEAGPIWTDSLDDDGMAMMAGWVDSTVFGAFPPDQNNGFSRDQTGIPTTDPARMQAYFAGELARRGLGAADFVETPAFGGPLYDQLVYEPGDCAAGVGVDATGTITWSGGPARYVYVLEGGSANPGVPPNLDLPQGTVWRVDVDPDDAPLDDGFGFGQVPAGASQGFPLAGAPSELVSGTDYTLYVLQDVYVPLTRCVFTAP